MKRIIADGLSGTALLKIKTIKTSWVELFRYFVGSDEPNELHSGVEECSARYSNTERVEDDRLISFYFV
jgi:hypothetical protein